MRKTEESGAPSETGQDGGIERDYSSYSSGRYDWSRADAWAADIALESWAEALKIWIGGSGSENNYNPGTQYYTSEGQFITSTSGGDYNRLFIIATNNVENFNSLKDDFFLSISSDGGKVFDQMILGGNNNGYWGDCYDLKSIFNFFDTYNGTAETEMIDRVSIYKMDYIKLDGRKVSKEYFRALRGAEVGFDMVKNNGVWSVDKNSINSIGSLNTNNPGSYYNPNGHLHSFVRELLGKKLSYKEKGKKERYVGEIHRGFLASDNDINQAFWQNKRSGTIFNAVVSSVGILFYNSSFGISISR